MEIGSTNKKNNVAHDCEQVVADGHRVKVIGDEWRIHYASLRVFPCCHQSQPALTGMYRVQTLLQQPCHIYIRRSMDVVQGDKMDEKT